VDNRVRLARFHMLDEHTTASAHTVSSSRLSTSSRTVLPIEALLFCSLVSKDGVLRFLLTEPEELRGTLLARRVSQLPCFARVVSAVLLLDCTDRCAPSGIAGSPIPLGPRALGFNNAGAYRKLPPPCTLSCTPSCGLALHVPPIQTAWPRRNAHSVHLLPAATPAVTGVTAGAGCQRPPCMNSIRAVCRPIPLHGCKAPRAPSMVSAHAALAAASSYSSAIVNFANASHRSPGPNRLCNR
jgi:hypothetical protein